MLKQKRKRRAGRSQISSEYEVEEILDERDDGWLLVSWTGYDSSDNTWEPESNLPKSKVRAFRKKQKASASETEYVIDKILEEDKDGMFLVSWVGYDEDGNTWQTESSLPSRLVAEFRKRQMGIEKKTNKNERTVPASPSAIQVENASSPVKKRKIIKKQKALTLSPPKAPVESSAVADKTIQKLCSTSTVDSASHKCGKRSIQKERGTPEKLCGVCFEGDGVGRSCAECDEPLHHFCSIELCAKFGVSEAMIGDNCYCSKECWDKKSGISSKDAPSTSPLLSPQVSHLHSEPKESKPPTKSQKQKSKTPERKPATSSTAPSTNKSKDADGIIGESVAFSPSTESLWMNSKRYGKVGSLFLVGVITRSVASSKQAGSTEARGIKRCKEVSYELRWTHTEFQSATDIHIISLAKAKEGIENYQKINGVSLAGEAWSSLCKPYHENTDDFDLSLWDDFKEVESSYARYESSHNLPNDQKDVELLNSMEFLPNATLYAPTDLYTHEDGSTNTRLKPEFAHLFKHSASSAFFAFLPVSFWRKVVESTNAHASASKKTAVTLSELMKFLGILFYMALVDKGEYANYWGEQVEDVVLGESSVSLDGVMSKQRFAFIREHFSFRSGVTPEELKKDPAARIRPLINMVKVRGSKYVDVGRNIVVDESTIACRSRYGRHMICYNAKKPTGKFHFKIYMCCCSKTWLSLNFRLHCKSEIDARLRDVVTSHEAEEFKLATEASSEIRRIVLEAVMPFHKSKRIVNTDNYYSSCQLLEALKVVGLYGRGTIRRDSKHAPKCFMLPKNRDNLPRGTTRQGVNVRDGIVAASWVDGSIVNILSNADDSTFTDVTRTVHNEKVTYKAPTCVWEYNAAMQGVDRLDQLRARFSLADGHSFRKWHKKLALAFVDIARCNAYICRNMTGVYENTRDTHRLFVSQLTSELLHGKWSDSIGDMGILFSSPVGISTTLFSPPPRPRVMRECIECVGVSSKQVFPQSRPKRECVVCRFEGRYPTECTLYCKMHCVSLCSKVYTDDFQVSDSGISSMTCWQKFHDWYYPRGLFNSRGHIKRSSAIFKSRKALRFGVDSASMSANPTSPAISETSLCHISDVASVTSHVSTNFGSPNLCVTRLLSSEPANEDSFVVAPVPRSSPLPSSHQSEENNEDSIDSVIV